MKIGCPCECVEHPCAVGIRNIEYDIDNTVGIGHKSGPPESLKRFAVAIDEVVGRLYAFFVGHYILNRYFLAFA